MLFGTGAFCNMIADLFESVFGPLFSAVNSMLASLGQPAISFTFGQACSLIGGTQ